jgi:hypothetical protein
MAVEAALFGHADRLGIDIVHHPVDLLGDPIPGAGAPAGCRGGQLFVEDSQHVGVGDQGRARDDRGEMSVLHVPGQEHLGQPRQPLDQCLSVRHLGGGALASDPQLGSHLDGDHLPVIDHPVLVGVAQLDHPLPRVMPQFDQTPRGGGTLGPQRLAGGVEVPNRFEHMCYFTRPG